MRAALDRAVRRRIASDGLTGVLMSGGLDSASVAAVAATQAPGRVCAYSAVFPDHPGGRRVRADRRAERRLGLARHHRRSARGGLLASALESIKPGSCRWSSWGDFWALPLLRAAAAEGVRVTLGGDGGDELFGARVLPARRPAARRTPVPGGALARELPGAGDRPPRREVARWWAAWRWPAPCPIACTSSLRRPLAGREAPRWLRPRGGTRSARLRRSAGLEAPGRAALVGQHRARAHARRRGDGRLRAPAPTRGARPACRRAIRCSTLTWWSSACASRRWPPSTATQPPRAARGDGRPAPRRGAAASQKALFDSLIVDCLTGPDGAAARRLLTDPGAELGAYVDLRGVQRALFDTARHRARAAVPVDVAGLAADAPRSAGCGPG